MCFCVVVTLSPIIMEVFHMGPSNSNHQPKQCPCQNCQSHLLLVQSPQSWVSWLRPIPDLFFEKTLGFPNAFEAGTFQDWCLGCPMDLSMANVAMEKLGKPLDIYSVCWAMDFVGVEVPSLGINMLTYMDRHMIWMIIFDRNRQCMPGIDWNHVKAGWLSTPVCLMRY